MEQPAGHSRRPLLGLAAAFAIGAALGADLAREALWVVLAGSAAAIALGVARSGRPGLAALAAAALGIGASGRAVEREAYAGTPLRRLLVAEAPEAPWLVRGTAWADSRRIEGRVHVSLDVTSVHIRGSARPAAGRARVVVADPAGRLEVAQGEALELWATLRPPRGPASPGVFDVEADAERRGIHAHGFCKSVALVRREAGRDQGGVAAAVSRWRRSARAVLDASLPGGDEQGLVRAMVTGDRTGVSAEAAEAFRIAGTYHVLAISGAQVALVAGLILLALRRLRATPLATAVLVCGGVWLYALFVGADPPVTRAAVMAAVLAVGRALDLDADAANLLGLAALALLLVSPSAIGDASFQLSFAATLALVLATPPVLALLPRLPLYADVAIAASLAAQLALAPLLAFHFHRLAPAALLLNLLAGPLASGVLLAGFGVLLAHLVVPPLQPAAAQLAWLFARGLLGSSEMVRPFAWLDLRVCSPGTLVVLVHLLGLAALARGRRGLAGALLGASLVALAVGPGTPADGRLWLTVLDVGQGDALVLRSPSGRVLLVDAGPRRAGLDAGESIVAPFLWSIGARRVDVLALTHADADHAGGAASLLRAFPVGALWEGPAAARGRDAAAGAAAPRLALRQGGRLAWDGVEIEVLGPAPGRPPTVSNDRSLVVRLRYRAVSMLLAGDVERGGERALLVRRADVLKVAHHGSRTSSSEAFLAGSRPRVALVSVGYANPFGHPHEEVLGRLARAGARVFRTDRDGTLSVVTDGASVVVLGARGAHDEVR